MRTSKLVQRGVSMTEAMLATTLTTIAAAGAGYVLLQNTSDVTAKAVAEHALSFQSAALNYAQKRRSEILAAAGDGTGAGNQCVVNYVSPAASEVANNTTKHTCAVDASYLKQVGELPASFKNTNAYGQAPVAVFKRVYNGATPTDNLELAIFNASKIGSVVYPSSQAAPNSTSLQRAMVSMGGTGGIVMADNLNATCPNDPALATNRFACGTQGGWRVKLDDFVN